jgi:uncharacterized protein (DUF1501 family)
MQHINLITRRGFVDRSMKVGLAAVLGSLIDIPPLLKRALADGSIGLNGKKLLFIFLRGANDSLNSVIPIRDSAYYTSRPIPAGNNPNIGIPMDPGGDAYYADNGGVADVFPTGTAATYGYDNGVRLGNGYAALHPSLKFLAPVYNGGHLALVHRVGYPKQSRSHFDSQNYWENGNPNNNLSKDGVLYRAMLESGFAHSRAVTAVSIQNSLPLILRGSQAAMSNLSDITRYDLLNIPNTLNTNALTKADLSLSNANNYLFADKRNRELLQSQYQNLVNTLPVFKDIANQMTANFLDNENTDGDYPYNLFPSNNNTNGGWIRSAGPPQVVDANKYVVPPNSTSYDFFRNLKACALVLNKTQAIVSGTEIGGFDTHKSEGGAIGDHANLQRRIGWALYALRKYFLSNPGECPWSNLVVVTLSEFGRTTVQNSDYGTDHAEAGVMFVAGGGIQGGVYGCSLDGTLPWKPGPRVPNNVDASGSMFAANPNVVAGYLRRRTDFRSVLGEIIRKHLGATPDQLNRIIPGYAKAGENLLSGGTSIDNVQISGELGLI